MGVKLTKVKGDWEEVANRARTTVGKEELGKEPSDNFKKTYDERNCWCSILYF